MHILITRRQQQSSQYAINPHFGTAVSRRSSATLSVAGVVCDQRDERA